jgi:hypothetical protein
MSEPEIDGNLIDEAGLAPMFLALHDAGKDWERRVRGHDMTGKRSAARRTRFDPQSRR